MKIGNADNIENISLDGKIDIEEQFEKMMLYTRETNYKQQKKSLDLMVQLNLHLLLV